MLADSGFKTMFTTAVSSAISALFKPTAAAPAGTQTLAAASTTAHAGIKVV